jgi:hypothetical protein
LDTPFAAGGIRALLRTLLWFALLACGAAAHALGLGEIRVQSNLGGSLRASIPLLGGNGDDLLQVCVKARLLTLDGAFILVPVVSIAHDPRTPTIILTSAQNINEPALTIAIEIACDEHLKREYQILLDLPANAIPEVQLAAVPAVAGPTLNPAAGVVPPVSRRPATRVAVAPDNGIVSTPNQPPLIVDHQLHRKPAHKGNVLRLSGATLQGDPLNAPGPRLTLSRALSAGPSGSGTNDASSNGNGEGGVGAGQTAAAFTEAARAAQNGAALSELGVTTSKLLTMEHKILSLQAELAHLTRQHVPPPAVPTAARAGSSEKLLVTMGLLLLASLLAIVWLLWRMLQLTSKQGADWASGLTEPAPEPTPTMPLHHASPFAFAERPDASGAATARVPMHHGTDTEMPTVEELTDAMHEAQFWISLNKPESAARVLEQYGDVDQPSSPLTWLYLLDLYRKINDQTKYDALLERFHNAFNGKVPEWGMPDNVTELQGLIALPLLLDKIAVLWNTDDIVPFLQSLLVDDRDGKREGFALEVYCDILFLIDIANDVQATDQHTRLSNALTLGPQQ